jgi:transmembrane sensor
MEISRISDKIDYESFRKLMESQGTEKDVSMILEMLSIPGKEAELEENSFQFWNQIPSEPEIMKYNEGHLLDKIHHQIKISEAVFVNNERPLRRLVGYLTRAAAILFIPVLITTGYLFNKINTSNGTLSYSKIYSPVGSRTTFSLPDGSTGWINGGSSIKFENSFSGTTRSIELTGEAYFNVTKNKDKAFIVVTPNIDIKVFGTSFNVMAYSDDALTEVTLEKGKVEIFKKRNNKIESIGILRPEQACIYNHKSDSQIIIPVRAAELISWKEGMLVFKYETFKEVVRRINRWYNVNIVIKDKILDSYIYYGTFKDESLDEVLKLLKLTAPIGYKDLGRVRNPDKSFEKRKIEIYFRDKNN